MKMKITVILILFLIPGYYDLCSARTETGVMEKSREALEREQDLRKRLAEERKTFIEKIIIKGVSLLTAKQIEEIILPFQKHWLGRNEINQITDSILRAYKQQGYAEQNIRISHEVKKQTLEIRIEELSP